MVMGAGFKLLGATVHELPQPEFNTNAPLPKEPTKRVKVKSSKFLLAGGERPIVGRIYEMPRSFAMDLVQRQLGTLIE